MQEIWKDIEGYEGFYQVSNLGRVRSIDHTIHRTDGTTAFYRGRILVPVGSPYLHVCLSKGPKHKQVRVHRLVAQAFIPNPNGYRQVDHIDCDKKNNRAENLRWCTTQENTRYAQENGLLNGNFDYSKVSEENKLAMKIHLMVPVIRDDGKRYASVHEAADELGVTHGAISHVLRGLVKTCKGHAFQYA